MNFNISLIAITFFLASACGVKGPPVPPAGSSIPSYTDQFLDKDGQQAQEEKKSEGEQAKKNEVAPRP